MTLALHKAEWKLTKDTPYRTLTGGLWCAYDYCREKWPGCCGHIYKLVIALSMLLKRQSTTHRSPIRAWCGLPLKAGLFMQFSVSYIRQFRVIASFFITLHPIWWQKVAEFPVLDIWMNLEKIIVKLILVIDGWGISCEINGRRLSLGRTDD